MRRLLCIIMVGVLSQPSYAQLFTKEKLRNIENFDQQKWSWGYFLGGNTYDFKFDYKEPGQDVEVYKKLGFNVGLIGNMRINDYMDLRIEPGMAFVKRKIVFPWLNEDISHGNSRDVKSTYIHLPLLMKFSTKRLNNFKPFVEVGLSTSFNLSSNEGAEEDNSQGEFRMKTQTYYWEIGFGIDFYLYFFKFTPSIRGVFALSNELKPDEDSNSPYTGNINKMQSRGIFINLKFQ